MISSRLDDEAPKIEQLRRAQRDRDVIATVLRNWLHETPMSRCSASSDLCDTWPLAYELTDKIVRALDGDDQP